MIGETVTRQRATVTTGRYGDETIDWSNPDEVDITNCAVAPRNDSEENDGRTAVIVGFTVYTPPGADVLPSDRLVIRGTVNEVDGEASVWVNPFVNINEGSEIQTRRVDG